MAAVDAPPEHRTSAEAARDRAVLWWQVAFVVAWSGAAAGLTWLLAKVFPEASAGFVGWLVVLANIGPSLDRAAGHGAATNMTARLPYVIVGLITAIFAFRRRRLIGRLADRWFPLLDAELFQPVRRAGALDPLWAPADPQTGLDMQPFAWVAPPAPGGDDPPSARRRAWDRLRAFLTDDVGDGRTDLFGQPRGHVERFRWTVLTGQPGSGKTRMALELARARARRDVLGDPLENLSTDQQRAHRRARRALRRTAFCRLVVPWLARLEGQGVHSTNDAPWHGSDPWDAWWLVASSARDRPVHRQRPRFDSRPLSGLSQWRPRRPTVLLLDDPLEGDAEHVIAALLEAEAYYRHPVRLLVVTQTVPIDLRIGAQGNAHRSDVRGFSQDVIRLGGDAGLGPAEVRVMAGSLERQLEEFHRKNETRRPRAMWKPDDPSVGRLLRRASGNALLVGLALYRIYRHPHQPEAARGALLQERVEQIVAALAAAGVKGRRLQAVAWATLAGPGAVPSAELSADEMRFDPDMLAAVPNLHHAPAPAPPLVQPEPIGDAFVRYVLSDQRCAADQRQQVIAAAWGAAPTAMLRAAWRLSAGDDTLARALRDGPQPKSEFDALEIALAQVQWAVQIPHADWDLGDVPGPAPVPDAPGGYVEAVPNVEDIQRYAGLRARASEAMRLALERVQALPPGRAASGLPALIALLEVNNTVAIIRGNAALACIVALVVRGLEDSSAWRNPAPAAEAADCLIRAFAALHRWGANPQLSLAHDSMALGDLVRRAASALEGDKDGVARAEGFVHALGPSFSFSNGELAAAVVSASAELSLAGDERALARAHRHLAIAASLRGDAAACKGSALRVDDIARPFAGEREFERQRAQAWGCVTSSQWNDPATCAATARLVDDIARPFAGEREFERERAQAWRWVTSSQHNDPATCAATARLVDDIARPFAGEREFERERAQAWRCVTSSQQTDPATCAATARLVDDIARPFAGEREFERQRAEAWCCVTYSQHNDPATCAATARLVDDIARPFAGEREFERQRAEAWCCVTSSQHNDPATCAATARLVDDIARPFAGEREFERERAQAWRCVTYSQQTDPATCAATARLVDDIARPFAGEREFERERGLAWRCVTYSQHNDPATCAATARLVDDIARPFAGEREFEHERAQAWCYVTYSQRTDPATCAATARLVDDIARPFAGEREFEHERAQAWRYVTLSQRNDPATCAATARLVDDIARPFAGEREFELQRGLARENAGFALPENRPESPNWFHPK